MTLIRPLLYFLQDLKGFLRHLDGAQMVRRGQVTVPTIQMEPRSLGPTAGPKSANLFIMGRSMGPLPSCIQHI